jgi:hypothetical protein
MARNIDQVMARALLSHDKLSLSNSNTDGSGLYYHGNKIAWLENNKGLMINMCGWGSLTTRSRLNEVLTQYKDKFVHGVDSIGIRQIKSVQHLTVKKEGQKEITIPIKTDEDLEINKIIRTIEVYDAVNKSKNKEDKVKPKEKYKPVWIMPKRNKGDQVE